ncbi:MAG: hypothetical protein AAB229_07265 [Candidatus Hydrogenedentota bacterium]
MRSPLLLALAILLPCSAHAREYHSSERIHALVREASGASSPLEIDRILRHAIEDTSIEPAPDSRAYATVSFDNWNPRARVWIKDIEAESLFRDVLLDHFLLDGTAIEGRVDLELEIRAGSPGTMKGTIHLRGANLHWKEGNFALQGVTGKVPFARVIGIVAPPRLPSSTENITIDTMIWSNHPAATNLTAAATYENNILRFDRMKMKIMGGAGVGTIVMDHRSTRWRIATMIKFEKVDLKRLNELLPGLPLFARVTEAELEGHIGLIFEAPNRIALSGKINSTGPGVIELSPKMHQVVRGFITQRVVKFQHLQLQLGHDDAGNLEARIDLYRRTAKSLLELFRGMPFAPLMVTIRIPILPFVQELSRN